MADAFLRVHLCRHGQSGNNVLAAHSAGAYETGRSPDAPLTDLGRVQARAVGRYLAATASAVPVPLAQIYTSAFERALETSEHIVKSMAEALGVPSPAAPGTASPLAHLSPRLWVDLHEVGGVFSHVHNPATGAKVGFAGVPGMSRAAVQMRFPSVRVPDDGTIDERGWWRSPNKETKDEGAVRVRGVLGELLQAAAELPHLPPLTAAEPAEDGAKTPVPAALRAAADSAAHAAFDLRRHLRPAALLAPEAKVDIAGSGSATPEASIPVPEAFDSAGSTASSARFHRGSRSGSGSGHGGAPAAAVAAPDRRGSGGDSDREPASATAVSLEELSRLRKYTGDGRLKLTGSSFASAGMSSGRSMSVLLVCHGDMIETMLRLIAAFKPSPGGSGSDGIGSSSGVGGGDAAATAAALAVAAQTMAPAQFCHHNCAISTFDIFPEGAIRLVRINDVSPLVFGSQMAVAAVPRPLPSPAGGAESPGAGAGSSPGTGSSSGNGGAVYITDLLTGGPVV